MPTIKQPPRLLLIALAFMLAFWGFSGGSALATAKEPASDGDQPQMTETASGETEASDEASAETGEIGDTSDKGDNPVSDLDCVDANTNAVDPSTAAEPPAALPLSVGEKHAGTSAELLATEYPVSNEAELQQAMWDIPIGTTGTVVLQGNISISNTITVPFNRTITLTSQTGSTFTITQTSAGNRILKVDGSSSTYAMNLTLENIVLDGNGVAGGVVVSGRNGTLTIGQDAVIQNASATDAGGGVRVENGSLVLAGGSILGNATSYAAWQDSSFGGGGVHMKGGTFTMTSGLIGSNTAKNGGGVNLTDGSVFTMTGGTISDNESTVNQGGGVLVAGGSAFTMSGSSVVENNRSDRGAGVNVMQSDSSFTMDAGTIRANSATIHGGGVLVNGPGTFTMNGGVIGGDSPTDANTADSGGGVCIYSDWTGNDPSFTMTGNSLIKNNTADNGGGVSRYNTAIATIVMRDNATITENSADTGGGMYLGGGSTTYFDMYDSSSIHHNTATDSGGGVNSISTEFNMHNTSSIHHNTAGGWGGGVAHWSNELFTMNDESSVHDNETTSSGGGITVTNRAGLVMNDQASVVDNTAGVNGGGIFTEYSAATPSNPTSLVMNGGTVARNTALGSAKGGGGIFFDGQADQSVTLSIGGDSVIVDNSAPNGHGGGIYSNEPYWGQMVIGPDTVFDRNTASAAYIPPSTVFTDYPSIEFASISIAGLVPHHPLNNYDINYTGSVPTSVYRVTYHGNGNDSGDAPASKLYAAGATVTVSDEGTLAKASHDFVGWNTSAVATVAEYEATDTFIMPTHDVDLYAIWMPSPVPSVLYTVTYHGNGHTAGDPHPSAQYAAGVSVTVLDKHTLVRDGYEFVGWHTDPASTQALHNPTDVFSMPANNVDLHAIWKAKDTPGPGDPGNPDPETPTDPGKTPSSAKPVTPQKMARTGDELGFAPLLVAGALVCLAGAAGACVLKRRREL